MTYNPFAILLALLRIILLVLSLIVFLVPYILYAKIFGTTEKQAFKLRRNWVALAKVILGISLEVEGSPAEETALYVSNHRSFADPLIQARYINSYVIAKAEVSNIPLIGKGAELTGVIYVERGNNKSRSAVRETMVKNLLSGKNVMVYPEAVSYTHLTLPTTPYV